MFMYFIRSNEDYSALEVIGFASSEKFGKFIDSSLFDVEGILLL